MDRKKKIGLAVTIVAVGAIIALQFQKDPQPAASNEPAAEPSVMASAPLPAAPAPIVSESRAAQSSTAFDGRIEPAPGTNLGPPDPSAAGSAFAASSTGVRKPADEDAPPSELVNLNTPDKTHRIVDGDSLQRLSQRYLGSADRYLELYAYNRDVLIDPDVLPIGATIRIPSRVVFAPDANNLAGITPAPVLPLVPLAAPTAPAPQATANSPAQAPSGRATSNATATAPANSPAGAPAAASAQKNGPRSYTVQEGDNLVDIARKMYGDGRKHELLFQANRRTMRAPTDLKPGMVLVVP